MSNVRDRILKELLGMHVNQTKSIANMPWTITRTPRGWQTNDQVGALYPKAESLADDIALILKNESLPGFKRYGEGTMRVTVGELRNIINEAVEWDANLHAMMGTPNELQHFISSMHPDDVADEDWVDSESGEVVLEKGKKARTCSLHPQYEKDQEVRILQRNAERDAEMAALDAEDAEYEEQRRAENDRLIDEYRKAIEEFTSNWTNFAEEMPDTAPEDAAADAAEGFFSIYPKWKQWARAAGMSKADMKSVVQDFVYEAMKTGRTPE